MFKFQKAKQANWVQHPTKKQTIAVVICMIVSTFLIVLATNVFSESPFRRMNILLMLIIFPALITTIKVCRNYSANKNAQF